MLKAGDKVRFVSAENHKRFPIFYPPVGTVGEIILIDENEILQIRWEKGSTSDDETWYCEEKDVERIENND